ncbi:diguanylate cyclase (GGDEF)-like protein [Krasilnikovia cinnamomea]|uniref:Diguanylate cyclase (GGDEF)-like protein n=1 Tax=Krasilnikovia cinnamomea TaxID=349313 RepID=A0A4Q7ZRU6_9ACTN|nr:GGDEF domain-containing protein [Krasilnikovia cinnamomea]RZU53159.1 diguanylate cyclase (GGDEF)-like protein [Krasilnikovia cinnamomea]
MGDSAANSLLPVPVTPYGPLDGLAERVHLLAQSGRADQALEAVQVFEPFARAFGDTKTAGFLLQGRMYALMYLGRYADAIPVGEQLLHHHESTGSVVAVAKTLADLADVNLRADRVSDAMRHLARAGLLLEQTTIRNDRYVAALASVICAATSMQLFETAHATYQQMSQWWASEGRTETTANHDLVYAETLLQWGLRLDQLGEHEEARPRLQRAATIFGRWSAACKERHQSQPFVALHSLALAKLGEVDRAEQLAAGIVAALRAAGDPYVAWPAHAALGIALRSRGDLVAARRELVAAAESLQISGSSSEFLIVDYELACLAVLEVGDHPSRDLRHMIELQARQLWQLRLQRVAMLRQARHREEHEQARRAAEAALLHDPLTGLGNRRRFDQLMNELDNGHLPAPTVLLFIDVDRFKSVNDTYSHGVGDAVLREIAATLRANCRADDIPVRYAGDEFVVFLHTDPDGARHVAERIRATIAATAYDDIAPGLRVSISAGIAAHESGMPAHQLLSTADANLYHAKRNGRDQIAA